MKKTTKPNTSIVRKPIKTYKEEYIDGMFSLRVTPVDYEYLEQFAVEWLDWALNDEDALKITQFYNLKRLHNTTVEGWMLRCPKLQHAHDLVLQVIGARREIGGLKGKYDSAIVRTTQLMYESSWKVLEEWRANLKAKTEGGLLSGIRVVEIERFADSPLVPHKKELE